MQQRVRVTSGGDCIVEQTTPENSGQFVVETSDDKLVFPALSHISSSINTSIIQTSGTIANTINLLTASINASSASINNSINQTSSSIPTSAFESRWDDLQGQFDAATGASSLTFEAYLGGFQMLFLSATQNDAFNMRFQMSHKWNKTSVRPHLHLLPCAAPSSPETVVMGYQYAWIPINGSYPTTWTTGTISLVISSSMLNVHQKLSIATVQPYVTASASDILLVRIMRSGSSAADDYTTTKTTGTGAANLGLLYCDCHFQQNSTGTTTEF